MSNKKILLSLLFLSLISLGVIYLLPQARVLNGYVARTVCSCHFEIGRPENQILAEDLGGGLFSLAGYTIDEKTKSVTSTLMGLSSKTAVYRKGLGCVLLKGPDDYKVKFTRVEDTQKQPPSWMATKHESSITQAEKSYIDSLAFDAGYAIAQQKTRALLILHKDRLVYEQYAKGTSSTTPLLGWSMTKSVLSTCAGIMVKNGNLSLHERPFEKSRNAHQAATTLRDLLQMRSGVEWDEDYGTYSSATKMLFDSDNVFELVRAMPFGPKEWEYSSGTSNLISGFIKSKFQDTEAYLQFPHTSLFHVLDLENAWIEPDESGTYLGSSYMYATARDWLKLGRLYLKMGNWNGIQVIDSSWVNFVQEEAPGSNGKYGGHFWLNKRGRSYPSAPHDLYTMDGYQGQLVAIIPSKDMVIVRLGLADINFDLLIKTILDAVEN